MCLQGSSVCVIPIALHFFFHFIIIAVILGELGLLVFAMGNAQAYLLVKFVKLGQVNVLDPHILNSARTYLSLGLAVPRALGTLWAHQDFRTEERLMLLLNPSSCLIILSSGP